MKRTILSLLLVISISAFSQSSQNVNSKKVDSVQLWNAHADSVLKHTSIAQFKDFIESIATVKQYGEVKFVDAYNAFVQQQYNAWIATSSKPKK